MSRGDPTYWRVSPNIWRHAAEHGWSADSLALAFYLLTCKHRTTEGLYWLPVGYMASDLAWVTERLTASLATLQAEDFVRYDHKTSVVFLVKAMKYQRPDNPNQWTAAIRNIKELPPTCLFPAFLEAAQEYAQGFAQALQKDLPQALTQGYTDPPAPAPALPKEDAAAVAHAHEAAEERGSSIEKEEPQEATRPTPPPDPMDDDDPMDALLLELWEVEGWRRKPKDDRAELARLGAAFPRADLAAAIQQLRAKALDGAVKANPRSALQAFVKQLHLQTPEARVIEDDAPPGPRVIADWKTQAECAAEAAAAARRMAAGGAA